MWGRRNHHKPKMLNSAGKWKSDLFFEENNVVYPIDEEAGNSIKKLSDIIVVGGGPSARNIIRVENS